MEICVSRLGEVRVMPAHAVCAVCARWFEPLLKQELIAEAVVCRYVGVCGCLHV